ncbi:hypothetical protein [Psychroserpens sp.]|uniref:hypothetical protein n=1 Tax=Psychroserpens sp. TaxID=2020870 RepID=UPI001B1B314F|nr:hypothetical protein [Psychroserpens sp.]MBO6605312.1 hypothetical protein [Psychroserpens sp.]MBO6630005.1 hypothetical protein [Psychroserpens sp.]MBO6653879.1 hypothetical protein [Psychroserpens sp.]MBO6682200.1 hypothetical protein [Psychroserpens sp.]MBO6748686.1 hypothetical protein [Psychroserpens sp.]
MNTITNNQFIEKFKTELVNASDQNYLIENEIEQIKYFTMTRNTEFAPNPFRSYNNNSTNSVFDLSNLGNKNPIVDAFHHYLRFEEVSSSEIQHLNRDAIHLGTQLAQYFTWLKDLKAKNEATKVKIKSNLNLEQRMLALYYLGLDLNKYDDTKTSKILSQVLNYNQDNIRKNLSQLYINSPKNKVRKTSNFEKIIKLFEDQQFAAIKKRIEDDMNSL